MEIIIASLLQPYWKKMFSLPDAAGEFFIEMQ